MKKKIQKKARKKCKMMVNNIPVGWCNKAGGSRGLSLARQTQSAEVNGAEQKMSTQGAVPVFPRKCHSKCQLLLFSALLKRRKIFSILSGAQQTQFQTQSPRNCIVIGKTK